MGQKLSYSLLLFVITSLGLFTWPAGRALAEEPNAPPHTPEAILEAAARSYATCQSYLDIGEVITDFSSARGEHTDRRWFSAALLRGCCFSFEFKQEDQDLASWQATMLRADSSGSREWWDISSPEARSAVFPLSLVGAIGLTGGCGGLLMTSLLPDELAGDGLGDLTTLTLLDDGSIDDWECFRIEGTASETGKKMVVWIDTKTMLLRRLEVHHAFEDIQTETVVTFDPQVDVHIDRDSLGPLSTGW